MVSPAGEVFVVIPPNYITSAQPRQASPVPVVQPSPDNLNKFLQAQPKALGVVQIMIGLMHLACWYGVADGFHSNSTMIIVVLGSLFVKCSLGMNIVSCPFAILEILVISGYYELSNLKQTCTSPLPRCEKEIGFKLGILAYLTLVNILEIGIVLSTSVFACSVLSCNTSKKPVLLPLEARQIISPAILSDQPCEPYEVLTSPPDEYSTLH